MSFTLAGLCLSGSDFFILVPASLHFPLIILIVPMIFPMIIFNPHVDCSLGCPEESASRLGSTPPLSCRAAWKPLPPRVPRSCRARCSATGFPLRGGGEEAGVPNDSPALQPGEVTTLQMGFKTFPGRGRWGPPHCLGHLA